MSEIIEFDIKKHGKIRHIVTYDPEFGKDLKKSHRKLLKKLEELESSKYSYAYKKGLCTRNAFEYHENSKIFIKLDIHEFYNSITIDKFKKYSHYFSSNGLDNVFTSSFVNDHLVTGFVASPRLSDLFMLDFDKCIEEYLITNPNLRYSRYCDDILISSIDSNFIELREFRDYIRTELNKINLTLNETKTREIDLRSDTAVSFLGLNMSLKTPKNKVTVSKGIILRIINLCKRYKMIQKNNVNHGNKKIENKLIRLKLIIKSYVCYVKNVSSDYSYGRLLKKYKNQFNEDWDKSDLNN